MSRRPHIFYGWYVLAASFVMLFLNAGARFVIGVMVKPMAVELEWSRSDISAAVMLNLFVYAFAIVVAGRFYDRWGPKWVIAGSTAILSAGFALMATMSHLWQLHLYFGVLAAAGFGGTAAPMFGAVISSWFDKWRGLAVSLAVAGTCLGQFVLIPLFSDLIEISGWRYASLWIAGLSLGVNLLLAFTVVRGDPRRLGLRAYGRRPEAAGTQGAARPESAKRPATGAPSAGVPGTRLPDLTLAQAMRTPSLWLFAVAMFMCGGADFLVVTHLVPMVTDYGLSAATGASMLAWLGLLSMVGVLLSGPASDAIGNKIPIAITFLMRVVLFALLLPLKGEVFFWVFSLGMGFTLMVTAVLMPTLAGALYGVRHIGFISGFVNTVHMLGGGLWTYVGGVVFDATGSYDLAFLLTAVASGIALVCTLLIREKRHLVPSRS